VGAEDRAMTEPARCERCGSDVPPDAPGGACPRCALAGAVPASDARPSAEEVAAKLPAFEILGVLGSGGMGVVFKARQKALDRIVALKVLPPATAKTPGFAERFQREAKAMARLAHPNIVAVHEFGESNGLFYLVLEFVDGLNVREAMAAGRIRPGEALTIVPQICDALQYAHDRGVVHRDIKPENVMIDKEGRVRIADFGLAKLADRDAGDPSLTGAGQVMGTLRYMAPEQWERPKEVDHRADIYSLGVVFYEMLTGELPMGKFEPPSSKAHVDVRIDEVVMRAIERDRERRWQHASDVKSKVGEISSAGAPPVAPPPQPAAPTPEEPSIVPVVVPFLVAAAALLSMFTTLNEGRRPLVLLVVAAAVIVGVVKTIRRREQMRRLGLVAPRRTEEQKLAEKVRREKAIEAIKESAEDPEPRGKWLPARTIALVTLAGLSAVAVLCGGFKLGPAGITFTGVAFVLGIVLWSMYDARKKLALEAEEGKREPPGPPIAMDIVSCVLIVVGVVAVGYAAFGDHKDDDEDEGLTATFGDGHLTIGGKSKPKADKSAHPRKPPADDRAPWEFDVDATNGKAVSDDDVKSIRENIWATWSKAQAIQGGDLSDELLLLYDNESQAAIELMTPDKKAKSAAGRLVGVPLLPADVVDLTKFRIQRVRVGDWDGEIFKSATVSATDGTKTIRFWMRHPGLIQTWLFVASPVELE
jgi:serine/threonine protein kinase